MMPWPGCQAAGPAALQHGWNYLALWDWDGMLERIPTDCM